MSEFKRMCEFKPQGLANVTWAFATVSIPDEKLFEALARAAERRVSEFNAQGLPNTAWAFATVNQSDEKLFTVLARAAEQRVSEFNAHDWQVGLHRDGLAVSGQAKNQGLAPSPTRHGLLQR